jgi:hypothetical protein
MWAPSVIIAAEDGLVTTLAALGTVVASFASVLALYLGVGRQYVRRPILELDTSERSVEASSYPTPHGSPLAQHGLLSVWRFDGHRPYGGSATPTRPPRWTGRSFRRWLSQGRYRCRVDVVPLNGPAVHYGGNLKVEAYDQQDGSQRFVASLRVRRLPPDSPLYPSLPCPSDEDC